MYIYIIYYYSSTTRTRKKSEKIKNGRKKMHCFESPNLEQNKGHIYSYTEIRNNLIYSLFPTNTLFYRKIKAISLIYRNPSSCFFQIGSPNFVESIGDLYIVHTLSSFHPLRRSSCHIKNKTQ